MPLRAITFDLDANPLANSSQSHTSRVECRSIEGQLGSVVEQYRTRAGIRIEVEDAALHGRQATRTPTPAAAMSPRLIRLGSA